MSDEPNPLHQALAQKLASLQAAGVQTLARRQAMEIVVNPATPAAAVPRPQSEVVSSAPIAPLRDAPMPRPKAAPPVGPAADSLIFRPFPTDLPNDATGRSELLTQLNEQVKTCRRCEHLACMRTQTVFGVGNILPRVVFFGEAPGADEDRQGEPFVGRAGQLLTKIIEACGWKRSDVYIMNVLKCRPPDNRNPEPAETANCREYFERQFEILQPEYIVCVGTIPAQALLETTEAVGKLRGRFHQYRGRKVLVTYHPSYLLRNPSAKKYVWDDMQMLLGEMGLPIPAKGG